jgi:hypothetical protein
VWWQPVGHHPVAAIAAGVAYEARVGGVGFVAGVAGELAARWRTRLVDGLDRALQRNVSRFGRRYRDWVKAGLRFIDVKGLATVGPFTPELDEVFVDVSLTPRPPHLVPAGLLADPPPGGTERRSLADFLDQLGPVVLAVIGAPGSGKTTLLRHTARQACQRRRGYPDQLPILLYLRDHVTAVLADPGVTLAALLRRTMGDLAAQEPPGWLDQRLAAGECLVLLDGLDEVARQEDRGLVATWAERQIQRYPANRYVITSRPYGYRSTGIEGAQVLQVREFTDAQVTRFVRGWYLAVERHSTGADDAGVTARAQEGADDLLRRLNGTPALHDLTVNPLLLTMITNVHRYRGALPAGRAGLYAEICQVMLWRRQEAKNLATQMTGEKKEAVLRALAYAMMHQRLFDLPRDDVLAETKPALRRLGRRIGPEEFLADASSNGLLVERESGQYSFAHQTFQEYLAAEHIHDKNLSGELTTAVSDPWWRETTLLYVASYDADPIVEACLAAGTIPALALAFDCADEDSDLDTDLRGRLDELLAAGTDPDTGPDRRRLIAGVLVTRYLRQQFRAGNGTRICTRPVPAGLYQVFREDTQTPPPDAPPPPADGDHEPAAGMRGSDAATFVHWVNAITNGQPTCRLLYESELEDPAVRQITSTTASIWANPDWSAWRVSGAVQASEDPSLWVVPGAQHPHHVTIATLTNRIQNDFTQSKPTLAALLLLRSSFHARNIYSYLVLARDIDRDIGLTRARELASELDPILDLVRELDPTLDRDTGLRLAQTRALAITRDLGSNLTPDRELDLAQTRARAIVGELDHAVSRAFDRYRELEAGLHDAADLAHALELARDYAHRYHPGSASDFEFGFTLNLDQTLNRVLGLYRDLDRDLNRDLDRDLDLDLTFLMGEALSHVLTPKAASTTARDDFIVRFSRDFTRTTGVAGSGYTVSPDTLTNQLATVLRIQDEHLEAYTRTWRAAITTRLDQAARPIFRRECPLTADFATSVRLAALCLASETDSPGQPEAGEAFREIAAGITLLQLRASGDHPATEMILLAVD